jgi:outer membrane autotransporter protein
MENGHTGDVISILPGDGHSLQFSGAEGESQLKVDAYLGGPDDDWADLLVIGGEVLGRTRVRVTNLYEGNGAYDPIGVKIVQADASFGDGTEFYLTEPVKSGLFDYGLFFDNSGETDDWYLRSDVNGAGEALGSVQTGLTTLFTESAGTWNQRTTELRDAFRDITGSTVGTHGSVSLPPTNGPGHGAWLVAFGGSQTRGASFTTTIDTYDGSYRQSAVGLLGGIDTAVDVEGEGTLLAGFLAGYMSSSMNFATEGTAGSLRGGSIGGYLTYLQGGLFADLLLKADFVSLAYSSGGSTANSTGRALGAIADVGYRVDNGPMFIEPLATLAYVNTTTGGFELLGTTIVFPNGNSLLGRAGVRAGNNSLSTTTERIETYLTASVWNDFLNGGSATIESGGTEVTVANLGSGLYFEVGGGIEIASLVNGVSGFLRGDVQFGQSVSGGSGRAGVRVNW